VVYLAEQERPVMRRVALKVIKPGMDTRQVIARFEAERQALAMMDHPNIAKVHDAGATENGRPYFVMELVGGVPITEYCDQCNLTTRKRLELFVTVCQAVQHAHQKGIIHRDLKPTNVMVSIQDSRAAPRIIDFGVAKAINQRLTEHTLATGYAQIIGTPMYMSPEQAELSPLGVDTRSDIYSLGVLLYELLTGTTPFDKVRLHSVPYDELRRIIREEEPPLPSTKISTLAAGLADTVAEHRRTDARRLRQTVHGELDWIVMKCLEKDRNRRYETASGLARDVERYLNDEAVQACPPSAAYRLKKFIRRNKVVAAFALLLVAAVAALTVSNIAIKQERDAKTTALARAQAVSNLLQDMLRSANPDEVKDVQYTVRQLLDDFSVSFGAGLPDQPEVEAEIRATIGRAYWRLGVTDKAEPHLTRALELRRSRFGPDHELVAESQVDMAWCRFGQGRLSEAEAAATDAMRIYRDRSTTGSPVFKASAVLQLVFSSSWRFDDAQRVTNEAMALAQASGVECPEIADILHNQASIYIDQSRYTDAEKAARQSVEMHRRLHEPGHPETAWGLYMLGTALQKQQKFAEAEDAFREALGIFRQRYRGDHHSLTSTLGNLKQVLRARGDQSALEALDSEEDNRSENPHEDVRVTGLLLKNNPTADQKEEARRLIRRAAEGFAKVAIDHPDDLARRANALHGYILAIKSCVAVPDFANEVDELNRRLEAELPQLLAAFPGSIDCQWRTLSLSHVWMLEVMNYPRYLPTAERVYGEMIEIFKTLPHSDPTRPQVWLHLARSYSQLGEIEWRLGKLQEAEAAFARALEIYDEHAAEIAVEPLPEVALTIASDYLHAALFLSATHKNDEAAKLVRKAAAMTAKYARNPVESVEMLWGVAIAQMRLRDDAGYRVTCKMLADLPVDTLDDLNKARQILTWCLAPDALEDMSLIVKRADELAANNSLGQPHVGPFCLGAALYRNEHYERAVQQLEKSIDAYPKNPVRGFDIINYQRLLLAMSKWKQGQRGEARRLLADALPYVDEQIRTPSTWSHIRANVEILRREAVALIEPNEANEAVENKSD
jgi:serine/threonine protein kinase/cytochrome c-type biogenesis protein CcmH/NrfG